MYDMKKLSGLVKELEDQLIVCMRCGMCQAVCPVFAQTGREADVARGKLALLDGLIRQSFREPGGVNERLTRCLLCGSCAANCPSGVKVLDIFLKARAILVGYMGLHPAKRFVFRAMLAHPKVFNSIAHSGGMLQGFFLRPADDFLGTSCARFSFPLGDRHVKALAPRSFLSGAGSIDKQGASGSKVAFFAGCMIDKIYPEIGHAVLRTLDRNGVGVFVPGDQGCCGMPALCSGDVGTFRKLILYNLERFSSSGFDWLVTACASCTTAIKHFWPMFGDNLDDAMGSRIKQMSEKTLDISQFIVDRTDVAAPVRSTDGERVPLTYHDPCHLKKSLGVWTQPRKLLRANPRYLFREMSEADTCCGCGGSFSLQHYDISASIGKRKRDSILQSKCSTVATSCPACMLHISDMLSQAGGHVQVKHAVEIYADSLE